MIRWLITLTALALSLPAKAETLAIVGAKLMTMTVSGEIENGNIIIRDGLIVAIGVDIPIPADARVIDGKDGVVTPGLIQADSSLGAVEVSQVQSTSDRATHSARMSAGFDISLGLNPDSILLPVARLGGITHSVTTPLYDDSDGRVLQFSGQAAVIDLGQRPDMVTRPHAAMVLEMGEGGAKRAGGARGAAIVALRTTLADVRHFARHSVAYDRGEGRPQTMSRLDLSALIPVVEGRMPLIIKVNRASDIREMMALAREEKLHIILDGAQEGWRVADEISAAKIPVMLDPLVNLPRSFSELGATMENAARLHAAGVLIILKTGSGVAHRARELRTGAGNAVAWGLPHAAAVAALTVNPARVFGVADNLGALKVGKPADLVLWSGDPLEPLSHPRLIFVEGRETPLTSRQNELRDRYKP
jgi:imidazolonepropionase-like amidohydrolase